MELFGGILAVKAVVFLTFSIFVIAAVGYSIGRIEVKGIDLGTAGVFIVALVYGCLLYGKLSDNLMAGDVSFATDALKIVENMGLVFFVTSVGFIAGPNFFGNLKRNFKSYVLLGAMIILAAAATCVLCIFIGGNFTNLDHDQFKAILVGILSGALTSTPAFSASKAAVGADLEALVSVGYGIAYLFGVIGVVLFVQIVPKVMKADMNEEVAKIATKEGGSAKRKNLILTEVDEFGFMAFSLAAVVGILVGSISYRNFSLTTTGGCLLTALVFGHYGHIGKISIVPKSSTLKMLRELGLMLFLIGAGVSGGAKFVQYFEPIYFLYGAIMTILPMIIGFVIAKNILKLPLLNNLGSLTGGMTSTPALGTLINMAGTEDIAAAYAATYPIALIAVVLASQLIILFC
ncbi:permease [Lachnospiraceae bacterium WCA-9-b2]|jgi:putative transport protein|uniref:Permease n=2 Tax=Sporofaciens musculi TaxID=2681861 RepID=A0A7X3MES4_9FIRM|nr:permease [Sporofaciens musculi]MXP75091.1 permease [Sporofaciens musculi]